MTTTLTFADVFRPCEKKQALFYDTALIITGSLLIAICAQIAIHLPFSPIPVTAQTFAVLLTGFLLGAKRGGLSVLLYLAQGAAGLPVFAGGRAGLAVFLSPTGGYLVGFLAAAYITGLLARSGWDRRIWSTVMAMIIGNGIIYAFGLAWLCLLLGVSRSVLTIGLYPFIVGDILKTAIAALILPVGWKLLEKLNIPEKSEKKNRTY